MKKVSVIVPAYNVEKYIGRCLDSLVNQTLKDIEIIVINDCSKDNTLGIINEYANKYKNIKTINNKVNCGIGKVRNIGIDKAAGEFIAFIDSDDYVDINMLKECYEYATSNDLDIVVCNYYKIFEDSDNKEEWNIENFDISNLHNNKELLFKINTSPWNKLYKKSLFEDKKMRFPEKIKYEDLALMTLLLSKAKRIGHINKAFNYYMVRGKSETTTVDEKVYDIFKILDIINDYYKKVKGMNLEIEYLNIEKILTYTISQRTIGNNKFRNKFINDAFLYLNSEFPNWRKNKYYLRRDKLKRFIEQNKFITKVYCYIYNKIKKR